MQQTKSSVFNPFVTEFSTGRHSTACGSHAIEQFGDTTRIVRATNVDGECVDDTVLQRLSQTMDIPCVKEQRMTRTQLCDMLRKMDTMSSNDPVRRGFVLPRPRRPVKILTHKAHLHEYFGSNRFMLDVLTRSTTMEEVHSAYEATLDGTFDDTLLAQCNYLLCAIVHVRMHEDDPDEPTILARFRQFAETDRLVAGASDGSLDIPSNI